MAPLPRKVYYDIFSWVITQVSFTFVMTPFLLLEVSKAWEVWRRLYFYDIFGVDVCMAFFASPAKGILVQRLKARMERPELARAKSDSGNDQVMFGVPVDAEAELQEIVAEVRAEIEKRSKEGMPLPDVRALVRETLAQLGEMGRKAAPEAAQEV